MSSLRVMDPGGRAHCRGERVGHKRGSLQPRLVGREQAGHVAEGKRRRRGVDESRGRGTDQFPGPFERAQGCLGLVDKARPSKAYERMKGT